MDQQYKTDESNAAIHKKNESNPDKKPDRARALYTSEQRYRTVVETMGDGLSEINEHQVTTYANKMLCEMWGRSLNEIIGVKVTRFLDEKNQKILADQLKKRKKGEKNPYEIAWTKKNGTKLTTLMTPTPYFDDQGNFKGSFAVITDISKQKKEKDLLEVKVAERTAALENKTEHLEEANTALRVLLKKREEDKHNLKERMLINVRELVLPYIDRIRETALSDKQAVCLDVMESTLNDLVSPFLHRLSLQFLKLTPSEIQVANLVKHGHSSKEIAGILNLSPQTVAFYRKNIRKKLGITKKDIHLRTFLAAMK
ncbi:MAG: PAS domain S-box protein [Desulfobacteraceae bacterium]|nr:PAS domain S-box protein [Desulfobacteraceae bacterium]